MKLGEFVSGVVERFSTSYTSGTTVSSASAASTPSNPIAMAVESLNGKYKTAWADNYEYVKFGNSDDVPEILDKMKLQSPTHSGILNKKSKMMSGNKLIYQETKIKSGEKARFNAFYKYCGGETKGVRSFVIDFSNSYQTYGAVPILLKFNKSGRLVTMKVLPVNSVRASLPNTSGVVDSYIVRRTFQRRAINEPDNKPRKVSAYRRNNTATEQLLYIVNPYSGNPIYGLPNYLSAYYFISSDYEFGRHIENSVKNGFTPKVLASMIGRNMTEEQKEVEYDHFKNSFTGNDADSFILSWVKKKEDAPDFKVLDVANLDRTIDVLARLNDAKILTAHSVTSPTLFGIQVAGKLGGTGTEMVTAYDTFRATETLPDREVMMTALNDIMAISGYGEVDFEIEDINITPNGANGLHDPEVAVSENSTL